MADVQLYTGQAAMTKAELIIASLAGGKLRLFASSLTLTAFTTRAELLAAECDFDGYPAGGYALAVWSGPTAPAGGGALITSPLTNPAYGPAGSPPKTNQCGGWWVEDEDTNVRVSGTYSPARAMAVVGDGWSVVIQIVEARNPTTF